MALIFPRLAQNFIKDGYFPTDSETLKRIVQTINLDPEQDIARIIDPCCGEGAALSYISSHIKQSDRKIVSFGIEIDNDRAWHAKTVLDHVAHANIEHVWMSMRSSGMLFLNPPYGDMISDKEDLGSEKQVRRFETHFFQKSIDWLQADGLLVLIVPFYIVDAKFASMIAGYCSDTSIWLAPEQEFRQCVIFGVKRRQKVQPTKREVSHLVVADLELQTLPEHWNLPKFTIPGINRAVVDKFTFKINQIDAPQLTAELQSKPTLWPSFKARFATHGANSVRPLMPMSQWHLALALVSGQVNGFVESSTGDRYLVKGSTHKTKQKSVEMDGDKETIVMLDRFEPRIIGFNLTPGEKFGSVLNIVNKMDEHEPSNTDELVEEGDYESV